MSKWCICQIWVIRAYFCTYHPINCQIRPVFLARQDSLAAAVSNVNFPSKQSVNYLAMHNPVLWTWPCQTNKPQRGGQLPLANLVSVRNDKGSPVFAIANIRAIMAVPNEIIITTISRVTHTHTSLRTQREREQSGTDHGRSLQI